MKKVVTSKSYKLTLSLVYFGQVSILVLFSLVILFLYSSGQLTPNEGVVETFQYFIPAATITFLSSAYFIFKMLVAKINPALELRQKLPKYQVAVLVRSALLELPGLLGAVAALITAEVYFLAATLLILIVFVLLRPTLYSIVEDLNLSAEEKSLLENPEAVVSETDYR